jgi:hypothetical protein
LFIGAHARDEITFALSIVERRYAFAVGSGAEQVAPFTTEAVHDSEERVLLEQMYEHEI